jgi:hypothetical protein
MHHRRQRMFDWIANDTQKFRFAGDHELLGERSEE